MFQIKPKSFKARKELIQEYQEQGKELEVRFICVDGEQRCSRLALQFLSDFYNKQLKSHKEPTFNVYDFPKQVIKHFLDIMHSIKVDLNIADLILLIKFLRDENKSGESDFECSLLESLTQKLKNANLPLATKLLVCHTIQVCFEVCWNPFDNCREYFEKLFMANYTRKELLTILYDIDWTANENKQLKQLIGKEEVAIESQMYIMIKDMKKKVQTEWNERLQMEIPTSSPNKRVIKVEFRCLTSALELKQSVHAFTTEVNIGCSVRELIDQVNTMRKIVKPGGELIIDGKRKITPPRNKQIPVETLFIHDCYGMVSMSETEKVERYQLRDDDVIVYCFNKTF